MNPPPTSAGDGQCVGVRWLAGLQRQCSSRQGGGAWVRFILWARLLWAGVALLLGVSVARAAVSVVEVERIDGGFRFTTQSDSAIYYILEESADLQDYSPLAIDWGTAAPIWDILIHPELQPLAFYRVGPVSVFAPRDSDGDRIDDVYEMRNPLILDPLNPNDANLDPDRNGKTHLQEYLEQFGLGSQSVVQAREVSLFNRGAAFARSDAHSREFSAFNLGSPSATIEAISRELSAYNGSGIAIAGYPVVASRELSAYNLGSSSARFEAISRVLSVYRGQAPPLLGDYPVIESRELSSYNLGAPTARVEAISREVSVNALHTSQ